MQSRIIFKIVATGLNFLMSIVIGVLVPRSIGPSLYGEYSYIISSFTFLFQVFMFTSNMGYIYFLSNKKYKIEEVNTFYFIFLIVVIFFVLLTTLISMNLEWGEKYLWNSISNKEFILLGLLLSILTLLQKTFVEYSDSTGNTIKTEKLKLISRLFLIISLLIIIFYFTLNLQLFLILSILNIILFVVLYSYFVKVSFVLLSFKRIKTILNDFYKYLKPLILFSIIGAIYLYLGRYTVQNTTNAQELGYYMASLNISTIPVQFISSIVAIYMSTMVLHFKKGDKNLMKNFFNNDLLKVYILHSIFSFFLLFNAEELVVLLLGKEYINTVNILKVLSIFSLIHTFGILGGNIYMSTNRTKEYSYINGIVLLIGCFYFIFILINGALDGFEFAIATTVFFGLRTIIQTINNLIYLNIPILIFIFRLIFITLIVSVFAFMCSKLLSAYLILNGLMFLIVMLILNYIFNDYMNINQLIKVKKNG